MAESHDERRRYIRYQVPVKVAVKGRGLDEACLTAEVGMGGCKIILSRHLPEGTLLHVDISSPRLPDALSGSAQIAWIARQEPWHCGLEFAPSLVESMGSFLRALVGTNTPLLTPVGQRLK